VTTLLAFVIGLAAGIFVTAPLILIMSRASIQRARDSERRARQAEHLADVGTLTGGLAHEIRNPLSTLTLNLQLLREDLIRPGQTADRRVAAKLDVIEQEARRLQTILDDFLQFAGKHELRLAVQPINPILEEAVAFYRERFQRRSIEVRTRFAEGLPPVAVDPARFKQAVSNLLLNAEAAMPHGGELLLGTEPDRGGVRVHVTDTGHGIPPQDLDKIFAPYYSTRPGGTGLGLPTVRRIVQEHEAALEVHSDLGKGTQFTIRLPAAARAVPVPGPAAPAVPQA
jgi:signal transduction histidine kinase